MSFLLYHCVCGLLQTLNPFRDIDKNPFWTGSVTVWSLSGPQRNQQKGATSKNIKKWKKYFLTLFGIFRAGQKAHHLIKAWWFLTWRCAVSTHLAITGNHRLETALFDEVFLGDRWVVSDWSSSSLLGLLSCLQKPTDSSKPLLLLSSLSSAAVLRASFLSDDRASFTGRARRDPLIEEGRSSERSLSFCSLEGSSLLLLRVCLGGC